ncbi:MAG: hypothetical protein ACKOW5_07945, partial [Actinomycetales bacterium]
APTIADDEYDRAFRELLELEDEYPQLQTGDSPSLSVGGRRAEMFAPVEHLVRMYSLDNAFTDEELEAWLQRVNKGAGEVGDYLCELKIDGLAVDAVYVDGRLRSLATRGDGRVGEDVTFNAAFIDAVPQVLTISKGAPVKAMPALLEVRGEVFFPVAAFERLNAEQLAMGASPFANPRNAAAGSLRQRIDRRQQDLAEAEAKAGERGRSKVDRLRKELEMATGRLAELRFTVHGIGALQGASIQRQSQGYTLLAALGLPTSERARVVPDAAGVRAYIAHYGLHRHDVEHEIDGVVVKVDDLAVQTQLARPLGRHGGQSPTNTRPRWCVLGYSTSLSTWVALAG